MCRFPHDTAVAFRRFCQVRERISRFETRVRFSTMTNVFAIR